MCEVLLRTVYRMLEGRRKEEQLRRLSICEPNAVGVLLFLELKITIRFGSMRQEIDW